MFTFYHVIQSLFGKESTNKMKLGKGLYLQYLNLGNQQSVKETLLNWVNVKWKKIVLNVKNKVKANVTKIHLWEEICQRTHLSFKSSQTNYITELV